MEPETLLEIHLKEKTFPLMSPYILSLLICLVNNINLEIYNINTRHRSILRLSGLKAFNHLPRHIKSLANDIKSFKTPLKRFLYHHSFYSIEEYYEYNDDKGHVNTYCKICDFDSLFYRSYDCLLIFYV